MVLTMTLSVPGSHLTGDLCRVPFPISLSPLSSFSVSTVRSIIEAYNGLKIIKANKQTNKKQS